MIGKDNFDVFGFAGSFIVGAATFVMYKAGLPLWILAVPFAASLILFGLGCLVYFTKDRRPSVVQEKAAREARQILDKLHPHFPNDNGVVSVRVFDVIRSQASLRPVEEEINKLLSGKVPASHLPAEHDEGKHILDWHLYDLCIVSTEHEEDLVAQIESTLRDHFPTIRIYLDVSLTIGPQEDLIRRIYFSGSRFCLALISAHLPSDSRRKEQLNVASERRLYPGPHENYLRPVALDETGKAYMEKRTDLAPFVKHINRIKPRNELFHSIIEDLIHELEIVLPRAEPYKVFISHSQKDVEFVAKLYKALVNKGVDCWIAEVDMMSGDPILETVEKALRNKSKVVTILSENALKSAWVKTEVEMALKIEQDCGEKLLFPIKIDNSVTFTTEEWASVIQQTLRIGDFTKPENFDRSLGRLIRALRGQGGSTGDLIGQ